MSRNRLYMLFTLLAVLMALLMVNITGLFAQTNGNLLQDPGFEDTNIKVVAQSQGEGILCAVNAAWGGWITETPRTADWQNRIPNCTGRNNAGFGFVRTGNRSQEFSRGFSTFSASVYQTVTVPENANVRGSAYVVMNISGENAAGANSVAAVGIDPTGGTNPLASQVVWSPVVRNALASNGFQQMTVDATAQGTRVTLFLYATQTVPTEGNGVFFDDASLIVGGGGGSNGTAVPANTPVPTAPPVVPFVNPQGAQPDGSIVHTVQAQDTLASISVAYGVPMDDIRELNPQIGQGRFLQIGAELLIKPAGSVEVTATTSNVQATPVASDGTAVAVQPTQVAAAPTTDSAAVQTGEAGPIAINTIFYASNDLEATRTFYTDVLGLVETSFFQDGDTGFLTYEFGSLKLIFQQSSEDLPVETEFVRLPNYDGGTIDGPSLVINVPSQEFRRLFNRVTAGGVEIFNNEILVPELGQRAIVLLDPMGLTVQVIAQDS